MGVARTAWRLAVHRGARLALATIALQCDACSREVALVAVGVAATEESVAYPGIALQFVGLERGERNYGTTARFRLLNSSEHDVFVDVGQPDGTSPWCNWEELADGKWLQPTRRVTTIRTGRVERFRVAAGGSFSIAQEFDARHFAPGARIRLWLRMDDTESGGTGFEAYSDVLRIDG